ncbi:MAG TPA: hypothetical protein VF282_02040 [Bacillota bacterium]
MDPSTAAAGSGAGTRTGPASPLRTLLLLVVVAQVLFWGAWWLGYTLLPEGVLRNTSGAAVVPLERLGGVARALAVLAWNGAAATLFVACANLLRVRRLPLGTIPPLAYWTLYGLLLGTNSFAAPAPERLAPSLAVLLNRAGVLELNAYLLVAAATAGRARWEQQAWWGGATRRVQPEPLGPAGWAMLAAAALLLIAGAVRETLMWCAAGGGC